MLKYFWTIINWVEGSKGTTMSPCSQNHVELLDQIITGDPGDVLAS
jgi:hypothetical protein